MMKFHILIGLGLKFMVFIFKSSDPRVQSIAPLNYINFCARQAPRFGQSATRQGRSHCATRLICVLRKTLGGVSRKMR